MANMNFDTIKQTLKSWLDEGFLEGELSVEPEWYVLWRPEELEEFNRDYQLAEYAPGFLTFGGNGGGELLAFDMRRSGNWPVVCFDPIDPEGSIEQIAPSFEQFIALVDSENA